MKLPNSERAEVPPAKVRDYLLSGRHPVGRFKAKFFRSLGYTSEDWEELSDALRTAAETIDVEEIQSPYGRKFRGEFDLVVPKKREARLVTIWILLDQDGGPRFVTAYPVE